MAAESDFNSLSNAFFGESLRVCRKVLSRLLFRFLLPISSIVKPTKDLSICLYTLAVSPSFGG